ncbi:hypothetical protein A4A49_34708 [Nicotiana attenuata]|uniref:Uncharacterized protein n=1 Tax=Nicotiana attenuata TaxID=49451 RepID=A0A1J6KHJ7_NICAT|nr:hypothetical protein A4A49_34708 [Nicotiana attenuata]
MLVGWGRGEEEESIDRFDEDVEDQGKEKTVVVSTEAIGTTANSTKVLSSGKMVGKPATNHAKQEWIQERKNKYQRDNMGHIVDNKQGKEADKDKRKAKLEEVATKNKFNALEVEEVHQPTLQITEGKGEDHSNGKKKEHGEKQSKKGYKKEKEGNTGALSPNPKASGVRVGKDANNKPAGENSGQLEDLDEINSTKVVGGDAIEVEDDQLGITKKTGDKVRDSSPPGDRLAMPSLKPGTPGIRLATLGLVPGSPDEATIVNPIPISTGKILAYVDGVPVYALENKLDDNVKIMDDTVGSDQSTGNGNGGDINRTDIYEQITTVIPGLGSVYEQQFKMMQAATSSMVNSNEMADEQEIIPRASGEIEEVPMEYGTDQIMQLHLNVPLKTPLQHLHDLVTHNVAPINEDLMRQNPMEDEGNDESITENFKQVARATTTFKKTKNNQNKEPQQPSRIMPRRAASLSK